MSKQSKRRSIWEETCGHCVYCGKEVPDELKTVDHIWPACRGGTMAKGNLVPACGPCNVWRDQIFPPSTVAHTDYVHYVRRKEGALGIPLL